VKLARKPNAAKAPKAAFASEPPGSGSGSGSRKKKGAAITAVSRKQANAIVDCALAKHKNQIGVSRVRAIVARGRNLAFGRSRRSVDRMLWPLWRSVDRAFARFVRSVVSVFARWERSVDGVLGRLGRSVLLAPQLHCLVRGSSRARSRLRRTSRGYALPCLKHIRVEIGRAHV